MKPQQLLSALLVVYWASPLLAQEAPAGRPPATESSPAPATEQADEEVPDNVREARERVRRGEVLFASGNYGAALVEFQQAYDVIGEHPNRYLVLYNIGQCHEHAFRYDEALRSYQEYLREGGDHADRAELVEQQVRELDALLATVHIQANVAEAALWVDERELGTAPSTVRIPGGMHVIELRAPGHQAAGREVRLPSGGEETLLFELERLAEPRRRLHPAYFWTSLGLTGASLVAATALGLTAMSTSNEVRARLDDDLERWDVAQGDLDAVSQLTLTTDILIGVTALFAIGSLVLGLLTRWQGEGADRARARLAIGANGAGAGLLLQGSL